MQICYKNNAPILGALSYSHSFPGRIECSCRILASQWPHANSNSYETAQRLFGGDSRSSLGMLSQREKPGSSRHLPSTCRHLAYASELRGKAPGLSGASSSHNLRHTCRCVSRCLADAGAPCRRGWCWASGPCAAFKAKRTTDYQLSSWQQRMRQGGCGKSSMRPARRLQQPLLLSCSVHAIKWFLDTERGVCGHRNPPSGWQQAVSLD